MTIPILLLCPTLAVPSAFAQSLSRHAPLRQEKIPDDMLTLVVGTRFVTPSATEMTANDRFVKLRVPTSEFNKTDQCIDQSALEMAQDYFNSLGRSLSKAGHFYFVPEADIKKTAAACENLHKLPPQAWQAGKTEVLAYGKRVLTTDAAALEVSLR